MQDHTQVRRPGDKHPVGNFGRRCAHPSLGISAPLGLRGRIFTTSIPAGKHRVECVGEPCRKHGLGAVGVR